MMSVPSLYKAIFASEMEDEVMNAFCSNNTSDVILYNRFKVKDSQMLRLFDNNELKKYHLNRNDILLSTSSSFEEPIGDETNETALDIFPNSLFNKKVSLSDDSFIGFMMENTDAKIVVFGDYEQRYDIPKTRATKVDDNNIEVDMEWNEFISYRVNDV